jgi:adenylate cyclase
VGAAEIDPERLVEAGLYDPAAPDAADRLDLLRYAIDAGATLGDIADADREGNLSSLVSDLHLRRGDLSAVELAVLRGAPVSAVVDTYQLLGIKLTDVDEPLFDEDEVRLFELLELGALTIPGEIGDEILRAIASGLAIIAESAVSAFVGSVEDELDEEGSQFHRAQVTTATADLANEIGSLLGPLFRHHLLDAVVRQRAAMAGSTDRLGSRLAVGFVDLVGFTTLTASMQARDLLEFVREFHRRTVDVVTKSGGRVVKHIGDEIMFSAIDPLRGCEIALSLVDAFSDDRSQPRGGLAFGHVVARHGDYYGPIVNLAARLADIAVPGEVLADAALVDAVDNDALAFQPAGQRMLKGFAEPVAVVSVARPA